MNLAHLPATSPAPCSTATDPTESIADAIRLRDVREFIADGERPVDADPAFRERLRETLWAIVSERVADGRGA